MTDQPISLKVTEPPVERLRRLSLTPDVPREELWRAIAESLININERLAELEASAAKRARRDAVIDAPSLEAEWRRQCRIKGWDQETPMPPSWNHDR